jgi:hypothetical protein
VNSNRGKLNGEGIVHELDDVMEIEKPALETWKMALEEVGSRHTFC